MSGPPGAGMVIAIIVRGTSILSAVIPAPLELLRRTNFFGALRALIDRLIDRVNIERMDMEEYLPKKADDPLAQLLRQDLDPLSVTELTARITALQGEIARTQVKINSAVNHKASAEALFKR